MTSAAFTILYSGIIVDREAIIWGSVGGFLGIGFGLSVLAPNLPGDYLKIIFVSIWLAFAINLFILNRVKKRKTYLTVDPPEKWKTALLFSTGVVGGVLSSLAGSGLDICMFSILTLFFRVSEKTATPTSVVLMAGNTCIGFFIQGVLLKGIASETWVYFAAAAPVVTVGAPIGAFVSSFLHRQILACFVYVTDSSQFVVALIVTDMDAGLWITCWGLLLLALILFGFIALLGQIYLIMRQSKKRKSLKAGIDQETEDTLDMDSLSSIELPVVGNLSTSITSPLHDIGDIEPDVVPPLPKKAKPMEPLSVRELGSVSPN